MKYLISSAFLFFLSLSTHAAVGWFYVDEVRAINDALAMEKSNFFRGSYLKSLEKTASGFKIILSNGCTIVLDRMPARNISSQPMLGPNPEVRLRINNKTSFCAGK